MGLIDAPNSHPPPTSHRTASLASPPSPWHQSQRLFPPVAEPTDNGGCLLCQPTPPWSPSSSFSPSRVWTRPPPVLLPSPISSAPTPSSVTMSPLTPSVCPQRRSRTSMSP
ncbi:hypothetical protein BDW42DRAFT_169740 [Aspergillus taichungensis]|uniref:Uncharacterized protein n=1 Tax=Aspergillus taichungensis TaxID=482145 RepID=A0A2J5HUR7_9EURO|nr:hypothetical protein BDW42DRAFT_169740 [Aspergillus taichungensis]